MLIVEDDVLVALGLRMVVEEAGHTAVGIATDTASALALAARERPDVALVDLDLRDGPTGGAIALALRTHHGAVPIFVTANPGMVPPEAKAVCLGLLAKPVSAKAVAASLNAAALAAGAQKYARPMLVRAA